MTETEIIEVVRQTLLLIIQLGIPPMLVGLVVGVTIALFQALTQVQEITLVFVPKIIVVFATIFALFPVMAQVMTGFIQSLMDRIVSIQ